MSFLFTQTSATLKAPAKVPAEFVLLQNLSKDKDGRHLTEDENKLLDTITKSPVAIPVPVSLARAMGNKTPSMKKGTRRGDAQLFTLSTMPPGLAKPKASSGSIFRVTQDIVIPSWFTSSAIAPSFAAANFTVSALDQISHLVALFDQYRMDQVEVWLSPSALITGAPGLLASVIDYDDSTALTAYNQALDYVNVLVAEGTAGHYRKFKPHCAVAAYSGAFSSFMNVESPWIDAASTGVQHYGFKIACTTASAGSAYDLTIRLSTSWRNVR